MAPVIHNDVSLLPSATFVPSGSGQFLVHGDFTHVNGLAVPGLARLGVDGKLDLSFAPDLAEGERMVSLAPLRDGRMVAVIGSAPVVVTATPVVVEGAVATDTPGSAGTVVVGPAAAGTRILRLRADGRKDPTFAAVACDGYPQLAPLSDGRVLVWGNFRALAGTVRNGLACLNGDGVPDAKFAPALTAATLSVSAVAPTADGGLVLSAVAYDGRGPAISLFRRLNPDGTVDPRFAPAGLDRNFSLLVVQPDGSVIAGNTTYGFIPPIDVGAAVGGEAAGGAAGGAATLPAGAVTSPVGDVRLPIGIASPASLVRYAPDGSIDRSFTVQISGLRGVSRLLSLGGGRLAVEATVSPVSSYYGGPAVFTLSAGGQVLQDWRKIPGAGEGQRLMAAMPDGRLLLLQGTLVVESSYYPVPYNASAPADSVVMPIFLGPTLVDPILAISPPDASAAPTTPLVALFTTVVHRYPGQVARLETDATGRVVAAGSFTQVDGQPRAGLVRFLADGRLDLRFAPSSGEVLLAPPDGRLIVRRTAIGPIDASDGFHRRFTRVVRLQDDGSVDSAFALPATLDPAKANWLLATTDGRALVAAFDNGDDKEENLRLIWLGADGRRLATLPAVFTGFTRVVIMPMDATGTAVPTEEIPRVFPVGYGRPNVLDRAQLLPDGRLLVAGAFSRVNGAARAGLVRLNADGSLDASYVPETAAISYANAALPLSDGRALVFGSSRAGGRWQAGVIRLRADGALDRTFQPPPVTIGSAARQLVDGSFFSGGRRYTADGWPDINFSPEPRLGTGAGYIQDALLASDGRLWLGGSFDRIKGHPRSALARLAPVEVAGVVVSAKSQTVVAGRDAYFQVAAGTARPATVQWTRDGVAIPGATAANFRLPAVRLADAGYYRATVTIGGQALTSEAAALTVVRSTSRLVNFSARSIVPPEGPPQVAGVVCDGAEPRTVLLRAVGLGLPGNPGTTVLAMPVLTFYADGRMTAEDRGSASSPANAGIARTVGAFPLRATTPVPIGAALGSALAPAIGAGTFAAATSSGDTRGGLSLFEFYDTASEGAPALVRNISIRGATGPGAAVLTAGFVVAGNGPLQLLVRGAGPALASFGVGGAVADPRLDLFASAAGAIAGNAGWADDAEIGAVARRVGAFAFRAGSRDAALLATLEPGAYSVQLASAGGAAGTALIEIYVIDN